MGSKKNIINKSMELVEKRPSVELEKVKDFSDSIDDKIKACQSVAEARISILESETKLVDSTSKLFNSINELGNTTIKMQQLKNKGNENLKEINLINNTFNKEIDSFYQDKIESRSIINKIVDKGLESDNLELISKGVDALLEIDGKSFHSETSISINNKYKRTNKNDDDDFTIDGI